MCCSYGNLSFIQLHVHVLRYCTPQQELRNVLADAVIVLHGEGSERIQTLLKNEAEAGITTGLTTHVKSSSRHTERECVVVVIYLEVVYLTSYFWLLLRLGGGGLPYKLEEIVVIETLYDDQYPGLSTFFQPHAHLGNEPRKLFDVTAGSSGKMCYISHMPHQLRDMYAGLSFL